MSDTGVKLSLFPWTQVFVVLRCLHCSSSIWNDSRECPYSRRWHIIYTIAVLEYTTTPERSILKEWTKSIDVLQRNIRLKLLQGLTDGDIFFRPLSKGKLAYYLTCQRWCFTTNNSRIILPWISPVWSRVFIWINAGNMKLCSVFNHQVRYVYD